jgi:hypothetical protein
MNIDPNIWYNIPIILHVPIQLIDSTTCCAVAMSVECDVMYIATFCCTQLKNLDFVLAWPPLHAHPEWCVPSEYMNYLIDGGFFLRPVYFLKV